LSISYLVAVKISGQFDHSTVSYGQMNSYCSFGHSAGAVCRVSGMGPTFGPLALVFWAWFLQQKCAIISLVSCPIDQTPIGPTQPKIWQSKWTEISVTLLLSLGSLHIHFAMLYFSPNYGQLT